VGDVSHVPPAARERIIPATVPGCIHTDLMDAGVIPDPAIGTNEQEVPWVSRTDWRYECEFEADAAIFQHHDLDLHFECLDTIATIELNGIEVGKAASEFIPWRFGVHGILKPGRNTLAVTFTSPLRHVHEMAAKLGHRPHNGDEQGWAPYNMVRKCASNFGWDWGPRVATCGITQGVGIEAGRAPQGTFSRLPASPRHRVGFHPEPFHFTIDGRATFVKGANWVPEGLWPRDRTPERVRQRLQQLLDANMTMIRVWGGGRYEPDWFYDLCDEMGIMVWQDFMFACACYPEEEPLRSLIEREARYQVARLSRHPCVVLWCGGNECHWAYESWGFKERLAKSSSPQTWGKHYWQEMLPRIVAELSPGTPYWANSPWSGDPSVHPNADDTGDRHTWDVWGEGYRAIVPRFCSEFGQQGPSNWRTLEEAGLLRDVTSENVDRPGGVTLPPDLTTRQLGPGGNARWYEQPMREWFREPRDLDEWHAMAQLLQARSLRTAIEWMRVHRPRCMGALVWQLNDAWPGLSWSLIDSAGRPKLAHEGVKQAFAPRMLTIQPIEGRLRLCVVNDLDTPARYLARVRRVGLDGTTLAEADHVELVAPPAGVSREIDVEAIVGTPGDVRREFIVADAAAHRATWFYAPDRELAYVDPALRFTRVRGTPLEAAMEVRASGVVRDPWLSERVIVPGAKVEMIRPLRTLLPGERACVRALWPLRSDGPPGDFDDAVLSSPGTILSASMFGGRA
jgi:beta-galactosidase/beta-glucuronidase